MTQDEAERWCKEKEMRFYSWTYSEHHETYPGQKRWDVSGWAWPKDNKDKVRIREIGSDLPTVVEKAKAKYDSVVK